MNVHNIPKVCYAVNMRIRRLNHSVYQLQYHLVWGTKYRRKFLKHYVRKTLIDSLYKTQKRYPDWFFHKINTGLDHVHILMEIPPKYTVAEVVQKLKSQASVDLKKQFKFIRQIYGVENGIWSDGYFVSSVGLNEDQISKYIEKQNNYDLGFNAEEELS